MASPGGAMVAPGDLTAGSPVWFIPPGSQAPLPGELLEVHRAARVILVSAQLHGKPQTFALQMGNGEEEGDTVWPREELGPTGVNDMTRLHDLHEAALLWNLKIRYEAGIIYTYAGSILVAVNPYRPVDGLYGLETARRYFEAESLGDLPPHLFALAAAARSALPNPQAILISGESGAGKTESTKLAVQFLAAVTPAPLGRAPVSEQILEAAPLLEAFGNARTPRNHNSSRFGKLLELYFRDGALAGARVAHYLLEKSRIVTQSPGERNYHVFYELLAGLDEEQRKSRGLLTAEHYFYLNQGGDSGGAGAGADWSSLCGAMQVLGIGDAEREDIIRVLASVLHLGNVYFHRRQLRHGQEGVQLGGGAEVKWAAHLLKVPAEALGRALTTRVTLAREERMRSPLPIDQALDARDAFAKALYSCLFNWLVLRINSIVHRAGLQDAQRICLLDIFGFEDLEENSFEQLCINYANESLQHYFTKHIFKLEQQEYQKERLDWQQLAWVDNSPVIQLLSKKPVGILHLLDDESNFPRASDNSFLEKCHYNHALNELYSRPRVGAKEFGIKHYAGQVWYNVEGFLDKNRDALRPDVVELLCSSGVSLVADMSQQLRAQHDANKTLPRGTNGRFVTMKPRTPTVSARFSDSLHQLLESMSKCNPWFVRCIKPNNDKSPMKLDMSCVLTQLRYLGMLDTIKIRQMGYPVRIPFQTFVDRYRCLLKTPPLRATPNREICNSILASMPPTGTEGVDYQLGAARVFVREALHRELERSRAIRLRTAATKIQSHVRGYLTRKHYKTLRRSAVHVQSWWRGQKRRREYLKLEKGVVKLQALVRGRIARKNYKKYREQYRRKMEAQQLAAKRRAAEQKAATMTVLEVPAELAFIYSKLDDWQPRHNEKNLTKMVGDVWLDDDRTTLPRDLNQFAFNKFSSVYFADGGQLSAKKHPIARPFLAKAAVRDQDFVDAVAVFKLILRWCDESAAGNEVKQKLLADYIVYKGLSSRGLRDEILVQLCNQASPTMSGTDEKSLERVWLLMAHCLSAFQPGTALYKYLLRLIVDRAPRHLSTTLCRLASTISSRNGTAGVRRAPPTQLEWRARRQNARPALLLHLSDERSMCVGVESWTTAETAASAALSAAGVHGPHTGWTVALHEPNHVIECCGSDYVLDSIGELEMHPTFPRSENSTNFNSYDTHQLRNEHNRLSAHEMSHQQHGLHNDIHSRSTHDLHLDVSSKRHSPQQPPAPPVRNSLQSPSRPKVPPPEPPPSRTPKTSNASLTRNDSHNDIVPEMNWKLEQKHRNKRFEQSRKISHEILSRDSALNERYFDSNAEKVRSRSLDNLLSSEPVQPQANLAELGLSQSRLNDRYHSVEQIGSNIAPSIASSKGTDMDYGTSSRGQTSRYIKSQYAGKRAPAGSQSSRAYIEKSSEFGGVRSSAMSDTSEAPSIASHVRRVRVPSHASDVDQFLDDLFSPVLDANIDELSDARSLAASIKGGPINLNEFLKQTIPDDNEITTLADALMLTRHIKGGGKEETKVASKNDRNKKIAEESVDDYITDLFDPIFVNDSLKRLTDGEKLIGAIKGGGSIHRANTNGGLSTFGYTGAPTSIATSDPVTYQQNLQRAFLESAMAQNIQIQKQLLAQNQALQTLLGSQEGDEEVEASGGSTVVKAVVHSPPRSATSPPPPPPPPPMPPPLHMTDPSEIRGFLDPYGRAKTVRIGKWRWPPPKDDVKDTSEDFVEFKMRQSKRRYTPQANGHDGDSPRRGRSESSPGIEWDEFEPNNMTPSPSHEPPSSRTARRSFEIGAERPSPGSVGKLKLSSEMRQRLERVTANHSVRSSSSTTEAPRNINKLEDARRMMIERQLGDNSRRESILAPPPLPPAPPGPAPPPPPLAPPPPHPPGGPAPNPPGREPASFARLRRDRDTFGVHQNEDVADDRHAFTANWNARRRDVTDASTGDDLASRFLLADRSWGEDRERSRSRGWKVDSATDMPPGGRDSDIYELQSGKDYKRMNGHHDDYERSRSPMDDFYEREDGRKNSRDMLIGRMRDRPRHENSNGDISSGRATFRTHMAQKERDLRMEAERRHSVSTQATNKTERIERDAPAPAALLPQDHIFLTYSRVPWKLRVRKEVFSPLETYSDPVVLDLLFAQVVRDLLAEGGSMRISNGERRAGTSLLRSHGITDTNSAVNARAQVRRDLVELARTWPFYFARLYAVRATSLDVQVLAVSHACVTLGAKTSNGLSVVRQLSLNGLRASISGGAVSPSGALQLCPARDTPITLHAQHAHQAHALITEFALQTTQLQPKPTTNGVSRTPDRDERSTHTTNESPSESRISNHHNTSPTNNTTPSPQPTGDGRHPLLQFAVDHFRQSPELEVLKADSSLKTKVKRNEWTWKQQTDLVKWQPGPLRAPLLRLPTSLTPAALECFLCVRAYCGDLTSNERTQHPDLSEVKCVYTVLMHCHSHPELRDELYCQLMKQTTSNRSPVPESCQRAWRLLSILAAYFSCSDTLRPFLIEYLSSAASDRRRPCQGTAAVCLANLRKTQRCGGRKNVPSVEEITAVSAGRSARRQLYRLPGGAERVVNTRCATVVADIVAELCEAIGVTSEVERAEFSLYCIVSGDALTMPLAADEYVLDVTTELQRARHPFYLIFCRSVWHHPLRTDAPLLYTEVLFNQVAPDYLEGLLLVLVGGGAPPANVLRDAATVAGLLHRAAGAVEPPHPRDLRFLLPKPLLALREPKPNRWSSWVNTEWQGIRSISPAEAKARVLTVLERWPLFGSSFFAVRRIAGTDWRDYVLALNRRGVHLLDTVTHETATHWPYAEVISTRKVRSEDGTLFLDVKVGSLLQQRVTRLQAEQAHEIARLVRQYVALQRGDLPSQNAGQM